MKPHEAISRTLLNTTAITAITSTRISHGLRPINTTTPCINFYEIGGSNRSYGLESRLYSINCRATSAGAAINLARLVIDLFHGTSGTGVYGYEDGSFEYSRAYLESDNGLIIEPENNIFNAPIEIRIIYPVSTVS